MKVKDFFFLCQFWSKQILEEEEEVQRHMKLEIATKASLMTWVRSDKG